MKFSLIISRFEIQTNREGMNKKTKKKTIVYVCCLENMKQFYGQNE